MLHTLTAAPRTRPARLGDTTSQIVGSSAQLASASLATVSAASSAGLITLSGTLAASIPVAGAVIAVGVVIFSLLHNSQGLMQDAETTQAVNNGEAYMKQNLAAWNASSKSLANQAQALTNYDNAWQAIVNFCSQASMGSPGQRCISEREPTGIYPYKTWYRDPIANDPSAGLVDKAAAAAAAVNMDPATINTSGANAPSPANAAWLIIGGGLILAALVIE